MAGAAVRPAFSGVAKVYCPHNREKDVVKTEVDVSLIGLSVGQLFDPAQHKIHRCGCCRNLFVDAGDEPVYCYACLQRPTHALGGPLAAPIGPVDG